MIRFLLRTIGFTMLAKLDHVEGLENVPIQGPAILMINHIAFIDPIVVVHVLPRNIIPLAKVEVYDYPFVGFLPKIWGVIPVRREEVDRRAVQQVQDVLRAGEIVLVAPEGTRSPSLTQGKEGVAYLAARSDAPVIPVAIEGTVGFPALRFTRAWSQPGAVVKFGRPFRYRRGINYRDRENLRNNDRRGDVHPGCNAAGTSPWCIRGYFEIDPRYDREVISLLLSYAIIWHGYCNGRT